MTEGSQVAFYKSETLQLYALMAFFVYLAVRILRLTAGYAHKVSGCSKRRSLFNQKHLASVGRKMIRRPVKIRSLHTKTNVTRCSFET